MITSLRAALSLRAFVAINHAATKAPKAQRITKIFFCEVCRNEYVSSCSFESQSLSGNESCSLADFLPQSHQQHKESQRYFFAKFVENDYISSCSFES